MGGVNRTALRIAAFICLILSSSTSAYAARTERLVDTWRPVAFVVDLKFDDRLESLTAVNTAIRILAIKDALRVVDFDFGDLPIDNVTIGGNRVTYQQGNGRLLVDLPAPMRTGTEIWINVWYHGRPKDGLIFSRDRDGQPTAVGDNWPDRVHHWIPCLDHPSAKASVTFSVTAPKHALVVANGALLNTEDRDAQTRTWLYAEPAPVSPYNMIVAVGPFARGEVTNKLPLWWYVPKSDAQFAARGFASAGSTVDLFSQLVAPFPYPKLALIVGATRFGGMENSGAIVFSQNLFSNFATAPKVAGFNAPESVIDVVAHETAHQWFGDSVTESTWADLWLSEGFATYFAGLYRERTQGQASFRSFLDDAATAYFNFEKTNRTPIHDTDTMNLMDLLNPNNYQKGAWVLHMLRGVVGDGAFFAGIRNYYGKHKSGVATTDDLRVELERSSGRDLRNFFTRWIYGSGHPVYDVTWRWTNGMKKSQGTVTVTITQTQPDGAFLTPLPLEIKMGTAVQKETVTPTAKTTVVVYTVNARPTEVRVDPAGWVLKEAQVKEVRAAAAGGTN